MKKITVYGLPLTPRRLIEQLAGASFCVSYATRKSLGLQLNAAIELVGKDQILLVDNGAFTHFRKGGTMDDAYLDGFIPWAQDILERCPNAVAVIPDVIGGTVEQNYSLIEQCWELDYDRCMAIWHLNEPLTYLTDLCDRFGWIGFGSAGEYWKAGTPAWHARIREAFAAIEAWVEKTGEPRPRIHMMRAQAFAHLYDFDSSDSTNLAVNHCRTKHEGDGHVARLAARIDGKIQASGGPETEAQKKRGLLDHVELTEMLDKWQLVRALEAANYQVTFEEEPEISDLHHEVAAMKEAA